MLLSLFKYLVVCQAGETSFARVLACSACSGFIGGIGKKWGLAIHYKTFEKNFFSSEFLRDFFYMNA